MKELDKFIKLRNELALKLEPAGIYAQKADWDFYTNSTEDNMKKSQKAWDNYSDFYKDEKMNKSFLGINKESLPKHEQKQLKDILKSFDEELNSGEEKKALRDKESEIAKKINSYVYKIDKNEISKTELVKILQTEKDTKIRQKAYETKVKAGDLIADDLIEFIKMRNGFAENKGYNNYFEYKLKEDYDVELTLLEILINEVYTKTSDKIKEIQNKKYSELKKFFNVEKLENYHYGILLDSNPEKEVNKILSEHNIELISKKTYAGMGYDIESLEKEGKLTLDLYPRKNKNTHGFCFGIEPGKDSRILANLTNNVISLDTLNHELGHCVYDLGISIGLNYFDKQPASSAFTEAIAMMMGDIMKKENILTDILPEGLSEKFKKSLKEDDANFVSRSLEIIEFEKELYKNPNQNPKLLWKNIKKKYFNRDEQEDNEWATIPHYLSHPAYYQNYFRASLMKAQIYNHLHEVLGNITENKKSANYLTENIFRHGAEIEEYDLIKILTGREFSACDFIESILN